MTTLQSNSARVWAEGGVQQLTFAGAPIVTSATFDALGRPTHLAWGNNLATDTVYGPRQKVQSIAVGSLLNLSYGYDPAGNALTMNETGEGWSRGFSYDWADRLTAAQEPMSGTPSKLWSYGYNAIGNMTFNSDWSGAGMDGSYVYGAQGGTGPAGPHAVTKIGGTSSTYTLTYDANGSTTSETTGLGYSYNFDGKIAAVSDTGAPLNPNAAFTYDANGDRVRKTWTNSQGRLQDLRYWAGFEELRDGATLKQDRYVMLGSSRVALLPSSGTATIYYLHPDIQGTVSLVTNQSGTVVERERFAPYGGPWAQTGSTPDLRYGYTGQEHDTESGQIHLGVRELHFTIGRFLTPDSIVPGPGNPQTLNRYAYALNNPVRYTDPSGFEAEQAKFCGKDGAKCEATLAAIPYVGPALARAFHIAKASHDAGASDFEAGMTMVVGSAIENAPKAMAVVGLADGATEILAVGAAAGAGGAELASVGAEAGSEAAATGNVAADGGIASRVGALRDAIPAAQQGRVTGVGIGEDASGNMQVLVGTSEKGGYLRPGVRGTLEPGETVVKGGMHAERNIVNHANANGLKLREVGASRPICSDCAKAIQGAGARAVTPLKVAP